MNTERELKTAEQRGYARGYARAIARKWPLSQLPHPPEPVVKAMYDAAKLLRDKADTICSQLMEDDDFSLMLGPGIDAVDDARQLLADWLTTIHTTPPVLANPTL